MTRPLREHAQIIRSKNAGPYRLTFDILFRDAETFRRVWESEAITRETVSRAFGIGSNQITSLFPVPMGNAIKITLRRPLPQGAVGESDMYGCQQHAPLLDLPVPDRD